MDAAKFISVHIENSTRGSESGVQNIKLAISKLQKKNALSRSVLLKYMHCRQKTTYSVYSVFVSTKNEEKILFT